MKREVHVADLWEARGEIPRAYPATGNRAKPNRTEATTRKFRQCHRETKATAPVLDSTRLSDNVGGVKHFLSVLLRALRRARHFALVEKQLPLPTKARS